MKSILNSKILIPALIAILLLSSLLVLAPLQLNVAAAPAASAGGGNGPGGVGTTAGGGLLELWLKADAGTFSDISCTTPQTTNNGVVSCWQDQSGNGNNVSRAAGPQYRDGAESLNGQPVLDFMGSTYLERDITDTGTDFTIFAVIVPTTTVANMAEWDSFFSTNTDPGIFDSFQLDVGGGFAGCTGQYRILLNDSGIAEPVCNGTYSANPAIVAFQWDSASVSAWNNGSLENTLAFTTLNPGFALFKIGVNRNLLNPWPNDIAEEIIYWTGLPDVERILVENYLQAKYNDSTVDNLTIAEDHYNGDTTANGNFDLNVAGIGQFNGTPHDVAHAAGMIVEDVSFLNDDGDWLLFGHNTLTNINTPADVPTTGVWSGASDPQRWMRSFYIDVTDDTTTVDCSIIPGTCLVNITFDFSAGGMNGKPALPESNYRLLGRAGTSGIFSDIAGASSIDDINNLVHFTNVDVTLLGSNFTLGTLDAGTSPTAIQLQDFSASAARPFLPSIIILGALGLAVLFFLGGRLALKRNR